VFELTPKLKNFPQFRFEKNLILENSSFDENRTITMSIKIFRNRNFIFNDFMTFKLFKYKEMKHLPKVKQIVKKICLIFDLKQLKIKEGCYSYGIKSKNLIYSLRYFGNGI
jgi:hypothetical protein